MKAKLVRTMNRALCRSLSAPTGQLEVRPTKARGQVVQLTPSLLARSFRGQLVSQDPTDEPAEKLLERIQCSRNSR
jgi:type I restriction enzyme S subunit